MKQNYCSVAIKKDGMRYCIVRTMNAGVFAGYLKQRKGSEVIVVEGRRLWYWEGAASLSQLAVEGVKKPDKCKFPITVPIVELLGVIEIIECTEAARLNILGVPIWKS
jgi:hypothetical protein